MNYYLQLTTDTPMGRTDEYAKELRANYPTDYLTDMWRQHMQYIRERLKAYGMNDYVFSNDFNGFAVETYRIPEQWMLEVRELARCYTKRDKMNFMYLRLWMEIYTK